MLLHHFQNKALSPSIAESILLLVHDVMLMILAGCTPGTAIFYFTSAVQILFAQDTIVSNLADQGILDARDVWTQLVRDMHGVDVCLQIFASQLSWTSWTTLSLARKKLALEGRISALNSRSWSIEAMLQGQVGLCMMGCGRALVFEAQQKRDDESHKQLFIGIRQYYARGTPAVPGLPHLSRPGSERQDRPKRSSVLDMPSK
ncbi:hypothetical protein V8E36_003164 [Tilletia maclaganii]